MQGAIATAALAQQTRCDHVIASGVEYDLSGLDGGAGFVITDVTNKTDPTRSATWEFHFSVCNNIFQPAVPTFCRTTFGDDGVTNSSAPAPGFRYCVGSNCPNDPKQQCKRLGDDAANTQLSVFNFNPARLGGRDRYP